MSSEILNKPHFFYLYQVYPDLDINNFSDKIEKNSIPLNQKPIYTTLDNVLRVGISLANVSFKLILICYRQLSQDEENIAFKNATEEDLTKWL